MKPSKELDDEGADGWGKLLVRLGLRRSGSKTCHLVSDPSLESSRDCSPAGALE